MKASATDFSTILDGRVQYRVPFFQRPYSWEDKDQLKVLWNDIKNIIETYQEEGKMGTHFIGSIVTMPASLENERQDIRRLLLIDGQQRLTTIVILLASIASVARKIDNALSEELYESYCINRHKKGDDRYKVLPTHLDRPAFFQIMEGQTPTDPESKITRAYKYFKTEITKLGTVDLQKLTTIICTGLQVVGIELSSDDNPYVVFESLNAKGLRLEQSDLVRNHVFMCVPFDKQDELYHKYWEPMLKRLGDNLSEFMRHFLIRDLNKFIKKDEIFMVMRNLISIENAYGYLVTLEKFSQYYRCLLDYRHETNAVLRQALETLGRLNITFHYPLLLGLYRYCEEGKLEVADFAGMLLDLENFYMRRLFAGKSIKGLNKDVIGYYNGMQQKPQGISRASLRQVLARSVANYPTDFDIQNKIIEQGFGGTGDQALYARVILEELEAFLSGKSIKEIQAKEYAVIFVFPNITNSPVLQAEWGSSLDIPIYVKTLGNLTLIDKEKAKDKEFIGRSFIEKKSTLVRSGLALNQYFVHHEHWGKDAIIQRTEGLADILLEIWKAFEESIEAGGTQMPGRTVPGKPYRFRLLGKVFVLEGRSWVSLAMSVYLEIEKQFPSTLEKASFQYPSIISTKPERFARSKELAKGFWININYTAVDHLENIHRVLACAGLSESDFEVDTLG